MQSTRFRHDFLHAIIRNVHEEEIGTWENVFANLAMDYSRRDSSVPWNYPGEPCAPSDIISHELPHIVDNMEKRLKKWKKSLDPDFKIYPALMTVIASLVSTVDRPIPYYAMVWMAAIPIVQLYYESRKWISLNDIILMYRTECGLKTGEYVNESMHRQGAYYETIFNFHDKAMRTIKQHVRELAIYDLWDEIDPEKFDTGVGNLTVWIPREIVEDIIELARKKNKKDAKDDTYGENDPVVRMMNFPRAVMSGE